MHLLLLPPDRSPLTYRGPTFEAIAAQVRIDRPTFPSDQDGLNDWLSANHMHARSGLYETAEAAKAASGDHRLSPRKRDLSSSASMLSKHIRAVRHDMGLDQGAFGVALGLEPKNASGTVSKWESCRLSPSGPIRLLIQIHATLEGRRLSTKINRSGEEFPFSKSLLGKEESPD